VESGEKRPVGRLRCIWEVGAKVDLGLMGHADVVVEWDQQ
jgi:hypothetical protein